MPSEFLFVNKDAKSASLTRSAASEQSFINSHVQRGRPHKRSARSGARSAVPRKTSKREKSEGSNDASQPDYEYLDDAQQSAAPAWATASLEASTTTFAVATLPARPHSRNADARDAKVSKAAASTKSAKGEGNKQARGKNRKVPSVKRSPILLNRAAVKPSPKDISQLMPTLIDPFEQSVVKIDPHVAKLCRYFCETFHPSVWHAERTYGGTYIHQASASAMLRRSLESEVEMNAMLACVAARIESVDAIPNQGSDKFMFNALMAVRQRFSYAPRDQLLMIVFHLYAGEAYRLNYQAAKIHLKAANVLFESWGGIQHIDPALRELFVIGDGHMSAILLEPCSFPCDYDPGSYWSVIPPALQIAPEQDLSGIAPALQNGRDETLFSEELRRAILETVECTWIVQNTALAQSPESAKATARWLQLRNASIRHRLLAYQPSDLMQEAVRISLLLWNLVAMVILGLKKLVSMISPKLQSVLQQARFVWHGRVELKTWILTVGAMCAVPDSSDEIWFVERLFAIGLADNIRRYKETHGAKVTTFDVLMNFQGKFLYYDKMQRYRLERLAALLETGPPQRHQSLAEFTKSASPES